MIFLGPDKCEIMFMIFFDTKHCLTDIKQLLQYGSKILFEAKFEFSKLCPRKTMGDDGSLMMAFLHPLEP